MERLGRPFEHTFSTRKGGRAVCGAGVPPGAEVGCRSPRRNRALRADDRRWSRVRQLDAGYLSSLDAETGCVHWSFPSSAVVRSGVTVGPMKTGASRIVAFFGDIRGNAYALDASSGE